MREGRDRGKKKSNPPPLQVKIIFGMIHSSPIEVSVANRSK